MRVTCLETINHHHSCQGKMLFDFSSSTWPSLALPSDVEAQTVIARLEAVLVIACLEHFSCVKQRIMMRYPVLTATSASAAPSHLWAPIMFQDYGAYCLC